MKKSRVLIGVIIIAIVSQAFAGPFGLAIGTTINEITKIAKIRAIEPKSEGYYEINPPLPHPEFNNYLVRVAPEAGLSYILAIGQDHKEELNGEEIKEVFQKIKNSIDDKYGFVAIVDEDKNNQGFWIDRINNSEAKYYAEWGQDLQKVNENNIKQISLEIHTGGKEGRNGHLALIYVFLNYDIAAKEIESYYNKVF